MAAEIPILYILYFLCFLYFLLTPRPKNFALMCILSLTKISTPFTY